MVAHRASQHPAMWGGRSEHSLARALALGVEEHPGRFVGGRGPAEEKALEPVAAVLPEEGLLLAALDAFRHDLQAKLVRHRALRERFYHQFFARTRVALTGMT